MLSGLLRLTILVRIVFRHATGYMHSFEQKQYTIHFPPSPQSAEDNSSLSMFHIYQQHGTGDAILPHASNNVTPTACEMAEKR